MTADACCDPRSIDSFIRPRNGVRGRKVPRETVEALLTDDARRRLASGGSFVCLARDCAVVYFGPAGIFEKGDIRTRVGFKETSAPRPVCYCFGHTLESIEEEILRTGRSTVAERIQAEVKAGRCSCEVKNPEGTCCLGNVARAVKGPR